MTSTATPDVIAELAGVQPGTPLDDLRGQRPEARAHAQGSYAALFNPADTSELSAIERLAVALRVATRHQSATAASHYRRRLIDTGANEQVIAEAGDSGAGNAAAPRLSAILRHADLLASRPAQARPDDLQALADVGLSTTAIVSLSQVIAFVSFQVRVLAGLQLLGAQPATAPPRHAAGAAGAHTTAPVGGGPPAKIVRPDASLKRPPTFTVEQLAWTPWLEPLDPADATPEQAAAVEARGNSPYFRLLARDVAVLTERTATDRGIFYTHGGAPRAERELSAAATSRLNGCIYCASVHARLAAQLSKRDADIDRLLRIGVGPGADLGLDDRWQAVVDLVVGLAQTPPAATSAHVARAREVGLADLEILDVIQAGAFFAWANRLMLTLGEPCYEP